MWHEGPGWFLSNSRGGKIRGTGGFMQPSQKSVILESESPKPPTSDPAIRKLKIEADGDPWKGLIKPKIRLTGRWLERAGFISGSHVHVTCVAPGVIELRCRDLLIVNDTKHTSSEPPKLSV